MGNLRAGQLALPFAVTLVLAACTSTRPLMPTPASYQEDSGVELFTETVPARRTPEVELLYITDRAPTVDPPGPEATLPYGEERSRSLGFGTASVVMGPGLDWPTVEQQSRLAQRTVPVNLELRGATELGRFPPKPYAAEVRPEGLVREPVTVARHAAARAALQAEIQRMLARSPSKRVVLYVHGFNETFATAAFTAAELCHFLGRQDVCAFFTWPASATGLFLTSYATTTESAQFSVTSLHRAVRMIADVPGVESIELLAHSRGAALALSAVRRLFVESLVYGIDPRAHHGLRNFVLMAPDVDADVAAAQLDVFTSDPDLLTHWSSPLLPGALRGRFTVYTSPDDKALGASSVLFRSRYRVGQMSAEGTSVEVQAEYAKYGIFDIISYEGEPTDRFGHAYFTTNPRVSADLIELIRNGTTPGAPGRSLVQAGPIFWRFPRPGEATTQE